MRTKSGEQYRVNRARVTASVFDVCRSFIFVIPMLMLPLSSCAGSIPSQPTPTSRSGLGDTEQNEEALLYINFTVTPEVAADLLQPESQGEAAREILDIASIYGLDIEQLHPGIEDPLMARNFFIPAPDQDTAQAIIARLQALPEVESAYLTPAGEPPGDLPGEAPGGAPF